MRFSKQKYSGLGFLDHEFSNVVDPRIFIFESFSQLKPVISSDAMQEGISRLPGMFVFVAGPLCTGTTAHTHHGMSF